MPEAAAREQQRADRRTKETAPDEWSTSAEFDVDPDDAP
jgi:hypothetical protein